MSRVRAILGFERTVADLPRTEAFYRDGLGFVRVGDPEPVSTAYREAMGLRDAVATRLSMRLGGRSVTFVAMDPRGDNHAAPSAVDPAFQHLAIPVRDMGAAMAHLAGVAPAPISRGGAQVLPPASGGVTAYKFRDPDGHPLELIFFPEGEPAKRWRDAPGLFLGIDHSAITVSDLDAATAFFTGALGLTIAQRGLNRGPEQARLDGVDDPVVDVLALEPPHPAPHVELLYYRESRVPQSSASARSATRYVFAADDPAAAARTIEAAGYAARVSADGSVVGVSGPDGHGMVFVAA